MKRIVAATILVSLAVVTVLAWMGRLPPKQAREPDFGITFSITYAWWLGLDWRETWLAIADELGVKQMRVPVYWSETEREQGVFRWEDTDWIMEEAAKRGIKLTLVIGMKGPRWPECYIPDWAEMLDATRREQAAITYIEETVRRYRRAPALERWQVENEAFLPFGECDGTNVWQFLREIARVKDLDDKPVQVTVSGELEPWLYAAIPADILGVSLYRMTWNRLLGYFVYPFPPAFYWLRGLLVSTLVDRVVISELQAEPWFPEPVQNRTPGEWYKTFDDERFRAHVEYARRTRISEVSLWGAEWWYYLKLHGEPRLWDVAKEIFSSK